jgi:hypothetical protein
MKRFFYILIVSLTVFVSYGFRGCDEAFCEFVGRFSQLAWGNSKYLVTGEYKMMVINYQDCTDSLAYNSVHSLNDIDDPGPFAPEGLSYICAIGDTGTVVWSSDGGNTWEDRSIPGLTQNLYGFDFVNYLSGGTHAVVCGESGIVYKSTNSGSSFVWENLNSITTENLNSIGTIGETFFIAVGEKGTIIRSTDGGQTWQDKSIGDTSAHFNRIFLKPSFFYYNRGWAVADNGKIYATTDYGGSWFPQNSGVTTNLYDLIFKNENEGIVVGAEGIVRYTTNAGSSWLEDSYFNGLTDGDIISITGVDSSTASALIRGGSDNPGGTTMLTVSSEPLDVDDNGNMIPTEYSLNQNYPNPFNPSTTIQFSIPEQSFVKLEIFNTLGEKITTLVSEELSTGNYKYEWNAEGLISGIYFYKINSNNFSQTKKLVLLK